jgi:hypothetical protein
MMTRLAISPLHCLCVVLGFSLFGIGCSVSPQEGQFACKADKECPKGWRCDIHGDHHCYSDPNQLSKPDESNSSDSTDTNTDTDTDIDAGADTDTGIDSDTNSDTDTDSDTDSDSDSDTDTDMDTDTDTDTDTDSDTDTDTDTDTDSDTDTDTDTDSDMDTNTNADSGIDTDTDSTNSCHLPIALDTFSAIWHGNLDDYSDTFPEISPKSCGSGTIDIWFKLTLNPGDRLTIQETNEADTILRQVMNCNVDDCIQIKDTPERFTIENNSSEISDFYFILTESADNSSPDREVTIEFTL